MAMSAGIDMVMLAPFNPKGVDEYMNIMKDLLISGDLHESRLDDAVKRILAVKLAMRLV